MADNAPLYFPSDRLPLTASADITGGQVVYVSGANTVAPTSTATSAWIGVAGHDALNGKQVVVYTSGVHQVPASGAIAAGALVIPAAAGAVADQSTPSAANDVQVVGIALSAAASSKVVIKLGR